MTQCSVDRLPALKAMANAWDGPISCAVWAGSRSQIDVTVAAATAAVAAVNARPANRCSLNVAVFVEDEDEAKDVECATDEDQDSSQPQMDVWASAYPINKLRNAGEGLVHNSHLDILSFLALPMSITKCSVH